MYSTHSAPIDHASSNTHFKYSTRVFSFRPSRDHAKGQNHNPEVPRSQKVIVSHDKAMIGSLWISNFLMALMSWGSWFWKWIFVGAWLHEEHLPVACLLYQKRLPTILHPKLPLQPGCCSKTRTHFVNTLGKPPFVVMKGLRVTDDQHQHANGLGRRLCDFQRQPFCLLKLPWLDSEWATISLKGAEFPWRTDIAQRHFSGIIACDFGHAAKQRKSQKIELLGWHPSMSRSTDENVLFEVTSQFPVIWVVRWRHTFEKAKGE